MTSFTPTHTGVSRFSFPDMLHPDGGRVSVKIGDLVSLAQSAYAKDIFYVVGHGPRGWSPLTFGSPYFNDLSALAHVFDDLRPVDPEPALEAPPAPAPATTAPGRNQGSLMNTQRATDTALLIAAAQRDSEDNEEFALQVCGICSHRNVLFTYWPEEKLAELSARINDSITMDTRLGTLEVAVRNAIQHTLS